MNKFAKRIFSAFRRRHLNHQLQQQFRRDYDSFCAKSRECGLNTPIPWDQRWPELNDQTGNTPFDPHYMYFPAWAARVLHKTSPSHHVDISSALIFSSILSAFVPVTFYDYRPANLILSNLEAKRCDLTNLEFNSNSISSLSCMHVVEHIGLGRYGDPLDPMGDLKAMKELQRVLRQNGDLLFVVPIGEARIQFNAHRIYNYRQIVETFDQLQLKSFSLIPDDADKHGMIDNATESAANTQKLGCGCFWFKKS